MIKRQSAVLSGVALAALLAGAPSAFAQNQNLFCGPSFDTPNLRVAGGLSSEVASLPVGVAGDRALTDCAPTSSGGPGFFAATAAATFDLSEATDLLSITLEAFRVDTVLAVVAPDGEVFYNDDGELLQNSQDELVYGSSVIQITNAQPGRYVVLTGVYDQTDSADVAQIRVQSLVLSCPDAREPAARQLTLQSDRELIAGTVSDLSGDAANCPGLPPETVGSLPTNATVLLSLPADAPALEITTQTLGSNDFDTTLLVEGPYGGLHFNDDYGDGLNSRVLIADATAGEYRVYVGGYAGNGGDVVVSVERLTELPCPNPAAEPLNRRSMFDSSNPAAFAFDAANDVQICQEYVDATAYGFFTAEPTMVLSIAPGQTGGLVNVDVEAEQDATLIVRTPSGVILYNDDRPENVNPLLTVDLFEAGDYAIWVGGFSPGPINGTVRVTPAN